MAANPSYLWSDGACPPMGTADNLIFKWFDKAYREGMSYLRTQPGVADIEVALSIIRGEYWTKDAFAPMAKLSGIYFNRINRQSEDCCYTLSNLDPQCELESNAKDDAQRILGEMLDRRTQEWLESPRNKEDLRNWLLRHREGVAYISPIMTDPILCDNYNDDAQCKLYSYWDVIPYQISEDRDFQGAEAVIIVNRPPLERARKVFNLPRLQADSGEPLHDGSLTGRAAHKVRDAWDAVAFWKRDIDRGQKYVTVYHVYINDKSINTSGSPTKMGQARNRNYVNPTETPDEPQWVDTAWTYEVPSFPGQVGTTEFRQEPITDPFGNPVVDPNTGQPATRSVEIMRSSTEEEARLYPTRRLIQIIGTGSNRIKWYDGPSFWAHGLVPVVPMRALDNGKDHMAGSMFRDAIALNTEYNRTLRGVMNKVRRMQNPTLLVHDHIPETSATEMVSGVPGMWWRWSGYTGMTPVQPAWPAEFYKVAPEEMGLLELLERLMDYTLGTHDTFALQEKAQIPSDDTIEHILSSKGDMMLDRGKRMEAAWLQLGYMLNMLFAQFDSLPRRRRNGGSDSSSPADIDADPGTMIPSHLPGEDPKLGPSKFSRLMRTRFYMQQMKFRVEPNTAYGFSNTEEKLSYELLRQRGFILPMDEEAKIFRFKNFGKFPGRTWIEKFASQMKYMATTQGVAGATGQIAATLTQAASALGHLAQILGAGGQGGGGQDSGGGMEGRKPTMAEPPEQVSKDGGTRQSISTSGS